MKKIHLFVFAALLCTLFLLLHSCMMPNEDKTDPADCYVPNSVMQDTFEIDGESLVWAHNDTIGAHLIIYEILDDINIDLTDQQSVGKQQLQNNDPTATNLYSIVSRSDTFALAEIPYAGAMNLYVYSIDNAGKIGSTPVVYARAACSIITTDVMMLTNPNCAAPTEIRNNPALAPNKSITIGWSSAPDSLYHCTITKGTAITSKFPIKLKINPATGKPEWAPALACSPTNLPTKTGTIYYFSDTASGLRYEITGTCTGFSIKNTGALGSGNIAVLVKRN